MEAIAVSWEKLGLKVNRMPMDFITFQNKIFGKAFGDNGAFNKATASGMWYLGASPVAKLSHSIVVSAAIHFDGEPCSRTVEIDDVSIDRMLATELVGN